MNAEEIKQKLEEFNKRWDIIEINDYKKEFDKFKTRFINILKKRKGSFNQEYILKYCQIRGITIPENDYNQYSYSLDIILKSFEIEECEKIFYKKIQILFYLPDKINNKYFPEDQHFIDLLFFETNDVLAFSKVNLEISVSNNEVVLYPKGEKELDDKLINQVLSFLNPESNTLFTEGLTCYLEGTDRSFIDAVDKMRRTLEEFLRFKLKNKKGLKENISEINKIHKADNKDIQIRKVISAVFSYLDEYFNENAKHKDGDIDDNECEYIIYQTGVLLRYINKLKIDSNKD